MKKELVKCNSCGVTLEVLRRNEEASRVIRCPNCSHQLRVVFQQSRQDEAETVYGGQPGQTSRADSHDEGRTVLASPTTMKNGKLYYGNQYYTLRMGSNVIGRKADTSHADVQIDTADKYMSRHHSLIKMTRVADGRLKALISNYQNKVTYVNGMQLLDNDEVGLLHGTQIRMGKTIIKYLEE